MIQNDIIAVQEDIANMGDKMRIYKTQTGVELFCISGGGLGDGKPSGKLCLVGPGFIENKKRAWYAMPWFECVNTPELFVFRIGSIYEYREVYSRAN